MTKQLPRYLDADAPDPYPVGFRLPLALYRQLAGIARYESRPVNTQLILFLEQAIADWEHANGVPDGQRPLRRSVAPAALTR